ncbi:MAG: hypothetical protein KKB03_04610 [Nanoarchaeota archaeon]|nr:hypothetical protein [Nanoarchaeota archaeon]MBU1135714.1 hypothetical protein [Nanoarchaeota archaeon]MBU2520494.1 hypothetical protein [Nanoarchaeota archaeon]
MIIFSWLLVITGLVGFGIAGYWDLKTTEFPEIVPYVMIIIGLAIHGIVSFIAYDVTLFLTSLATGGIFLGFGFALYFLKQWGDGDAWLMGAMGFLFPAAQWFSLINPQLNLTLIPFQLMLLMNFFFVSFSYLIIYSIGLGLRSPKQIKKFSKELRSKTKTILIPFIILLIFSISMSYHAVINLSVTLQNVIPMLLFPVLFLFLSIFFHYGRFVEKTLFKKTIDTKNLRLGDVPANERWKGLTEEGIKQFKKNGGEIQIKDGIRFAPVFLITLIITLLFGNLVLFFLV